MAEVKAVIGEERSGVTNRIVDYAILSDGAEIYRGTVTEDGTATDEQVLASVEQVADREAQKVLGVTEAVKNQPLKNREIPLLVATAMLAVKEPAKEAGEELAGETVSP